MLSLADRSPAQKERKKRKQGNSRRNHMLACSVFDIETRAHLAFTKEAR